MFIKLHFINALGHAHIRIIKISRIQEVRPSYYHDDQCEVQLSGDKIFHRVTESIEEVFGTIGGDTGVTAAPKQPSKDFISFAALLEKEQKGE